MRARIESLGISDSLRGWGRKRGSVDHAVIAGRHCLRASSYAPSDVNLLINAGVYRDRHIGEPAMATFVQRKLKINPEFHEKKTFSFDVINGGCGMLSAFSILAQMIGSGAIRLGMVVSSDCNSDKNPDPSFAYRPSGSAALVDISPDADRGFGRFVFDHFPEHAELYTGVIDIAEKRGKIRIFQDERLMDAYLSAAPKTFDKLLAAENLKREEVDWVIPSQISPEFPAHLSTALGIPPTKVLDCTGILKADTFTTSVFLSLYHAQKSKRIAAGNRIVFLTLGSGVTVGCAAYYT